HAQQRHRLALAGGDEHVHLATRPDVRHLGREADELVGLLAHGADHHDDLVAAADGARDVVGDLADAVGVGHGGAAELLDDQGHGRQRYRRAEVAGDNAVAGRAGAGARRDRPPDPPAPEVTTRWSGQVRGALDERAPRLEALDGVGRVGLEEGADGPQVVAAEGQHPAVVVAALDDDGPDEPLDGGRLGHPVERLHVEDQLGRALGRGRLLTEQDRHGHVVELGQLVQAGEADGAEAALVGADGGCAPAPGGFALHVVERHAPGLPQGPQPPADLDGHVRRRRLFIWLIVAHVWFSWWGEVTWNRLSHALSHV